jgi:hypothetical protein
MKKPVFSIEEDYFACLLSLVIVVLCLMGIFPNLP